MRHARKGAIITTKLTCRLSAQASRCSQVYGGLVICAWLARHERSKVWETAQAITAVRKSSRHMLAFRDGIRVADISNNWWLAAVQEFMAELRGPRDGPLAWRLAPEVTVHVGRLQGRHAQCQPKACWGVKLYSEDEPICTSATSLQAHIHTVAGRLVHRWCQQYAERPVGLHRQAITC